MPNFKLLTVTAIILVSSSVLAFGGGGKKKMFDEEWMQGVDAFGMYFGGKGKANIKFKCDDPNATPNNKGVCDCKKGYKKENDVCVTDACVNFKETDCITECISLNGVASYTYPESCHDGWLCTSDTHKCVDPCYEKECQTCTPRNGQQDWTWWANKTSCSTGWCQNGECESACKNKTLGECDESCDIHTGIITSKTGGTCHNPNGTANNKDFICQSGSCVDPCNSITKDPCKTYAAQNGQCVETGNKTGTCDNPNKTAGNGDYICHAGSCTNPCDLENYTECQTCTAVSGQAQLVNKGTDQQCGTNNQYWCDGNGKCNDPCKDFILTAPCTECYVDNGVPKARNATTQIACDNPNEATGNGNFVCQIGTGVCQNPCDLKTDKDSCKNYTAQNKQCVENSNKDDFTSCPDGNGANNHICQSGHCTDPCTANRYHTDDPYTVCKLWRANNGYCRSYDNNSNTTTCPDGNGANNYICQSGTCKDPCTLGEHANFAPTICFYAHHAENGQCAPDYAAPGTQNCDSVSFHVCNGQGVCTCPDGQFSSHFGGSNGSCYSCTYSASITITEEDDCGVCGDLREAVPCGDGSGTCCSLKNCGNNYFRAGTSCYKCSDTSHFPPEATQLECDACNGTDNPRILWESNGKNYCVIKDCPSGHFHQHDGYCQGCHDSSYYLIPQKDCDSCNGTMYERMMWEYNGENYCVLKNCSSTSFRGITGACTVCSGKYGVESIAEYCANCDNTENPRFIGTDNKCYICTATDSVSTTLGACMKCPNRTYDAETGKCDLCDGECPTCDADHLGNCHKAECQALGNGYTYSAEHGCQPPCNTTNYQSCNQAQCQALGNGYTYSAEHGCQPPCSTTHYQSCTQAECATFGDDYTYSEEDGCHPVCSTTNYQLCSEAECNELTGSYGFAYLNGACKSCLHTPEACDAINCGTLGYVWNDATEKCQSCATDNQCECCQSCDLAKSSDTYGRCVADAQSTHVCELPDESGYMKSCNPEDGYTCKKRGYIFTTAYHTCKSCSDPQNYPAGEGVYPGGWQWSENMNTCYDMCTTDAQCQNLEHSEEYRCSSDHLCVKIECTTSSDCTDGKTCDTSVGQCVQSSSLQSCSSYADCPNGKFCVFPENTQMATTNCYGKPATGTCTSAPYSYSITINNTTYTHAISPYNYWSMQDFCQSKDKTMLTSSELLTIYSTWNHWAEDEDDDNAPVPLVNNWTQNAFVRTDNDDDYTGIADPISGNVVNSSDGQMTYCLTNIATTVCK